MIDMIGSVTTRTGSSVKLRIALVTARGGAGARPGHAAARRRHCAGGCRRRTPPAGTTRRVDWTRFDAALLRSTWDYVDRIDEFLAWCRSLRRRNAPWLNPPDVVRWNTDKHYLAQLARAGVPVVPTRFVEAGRPMPARARRVPRRWRVAACTVGDAVRVRRVRRQAGDRRRLTRRRALRADDAGRALEHVQRLLAAGRSALLQPYLATRGRARRDGGAVPRRRIQPRGPQGPAAASRGRRWSKGCSRPRTSGRAMQTRPNSPIAAAAYAAIPFARAGRTRAST